jgi:hypothetical protein
MMPNSVNGAPFRPARFAGTALVFVLGLALAACGGGGGGGSPSSGNGGNGGGTGPTNGGGSLGVTSPPFFLSGGAGSSLAGNALVVDNPTNGATATVASAGAWQNQATISQWVAAAAGGGAQQVGVRYRVFAATSSTSAAAAGSLGMTDLAMTASGAVLTTTLSSLNFSTFTPALCGTTSGSVASAPNPPLVIADNANPANSMLVYRAGTCGAATDQFVVVPLTASAATAPTLTGLGGKIEPVDAVRNSSGAITALLVIDHNTTPVTLGMVTGGSGAAILAALGAGTYTTIAPAPTVAPAPANAIAGAGLTSATGDFRTLGVKLQADGTSVWLFNDFSQILGASLNPASPGSPMFAFVANALDHDVIQAPAVLDGTTAFVAASDPTQSTNQIFSIDTTALTASAVSGGSASAAAHVVVQDNAAATTTTPAIGIYFIGVTATNLVYSYSDGSAIKVAPKVAASMLTVVGATDHAVYSSATHGALDSSALSTEHVLVGNVLFFTVQASTTALGMQAYYLDTSVASPAVALLGGATGAGSQVLGTYLAANATAASPVIGGALVLELASGASAVSTGPGVYANASLAAFASSGATAIVLGKLPIPTQSIYNGLTLSEAPLQAGVGALIAVSGADQQSGNPAQDLFAFLPGTAASLVQGTGFMQ